VAEARTPDRVEVYRRGRKFIVTSTVKDPFHGSSWFAAPPAVVLPDTVTDVQLGAAVMGAADAVCELPADDVEAAERGQESEDAVLADTGFSAWSALLRNAKLVSVTRRSDGRWRIQPMRKLRYGWDSPKDLPLCRLTELDADVEEGQLGEALRSRLAEPTPTA
jgi:hypothetical protein